MMNTGKCAAVEFVNDLYQEPVNNNGNWEGEDEDPREGTEAANLGKKSFSNLLDSCIVPNFEIKNPP